MRRPNGWVLGAVFAAALAPMARAQMMGGETEPQAAKRSAAETQDADMPAPTAAQQKAAQAFAAKSKVAVAAVTARPASLAPLTQRERVLQLLDRFTFGPKPGDVDRVLSIGADKWVDAQMHPDTVPNGALDKRLQDFPTVTMTAAQALTAFPNNGMIAAVADGKVPYPADPLLASVYETQVYRLNQVRTRKKADGTVQAQVELTDARKDAQKKADQATAARIAGELFALPKGQRMAALIQMPVVDRIAFTSMVSGDQRNLLLADFTPRERESFQAMGNGGQPSGQIGYELAEARVVRDILTERQMQEVMTDFWFNHFNIFLPKDSDEYYTSSYERDVIRKNALGSFKDLLLATAQSPAMMVYLDNYLSIGPDSLANGVDPKNPNAKRGTKGLNENYGREVMELHTVGVNGGYTQADVTALAAILTGWGVDRAGQGGPFLFDPKRHEPGPKVWLGYQIDDDGKIVAKGVTAKAGTTFGPALYGSSFLAANDASVQQGVTALTILAESPQTAHFISILLAQHFVADAPPPALVDRLQKVFLATHGDIKSVLKALIASPEFNSRQYFRNKVKTPLEFLASSFRASATDPSNPGALLNTLRTMGMPLYYALPPTGYYLTAEQWMNTAALVDRLNFAYQLTNNKFSNQKFDAPRLLAMALLVPTAPAAAAAAVRPAAGAVPAKSDARMMNVSSVQSDDAARAPQASAAGADVALRVLEATMIGGTVSPQTNQLIHKQLDQQPANTSAADTLNLLTALVMGSPEFQNR